MYDGRGAVGCFSPLHARRASRSMQASPQQGTVVPSQQSGGVTGSSLFWSWDEQQASAPLFLASPSMFAMWSLAAPAPLLPWQPSTGSSQQRDCTLISSSFLLHSSWLSSSWSSSLLFAVLPLATSPGPSPEVDCDVGSAVGCAGGRGGPQQAEPQAMFRG